MHNWSLVCFTLLAQSGIGLVWISILERWTGEAGTTVSQLWPLSTALVLTALGLITATAHLAKPRLAPHAVRNITNSWLSREVLLVQIFVGILALTILLTLLDIQTGLWVFEALACLFGGLALFSMTRVYLLRTVPVWNTVATPLEFVGSALLLGGGQYILITILMASGRPGWHPSLLVAGTGIGLGLILKLAAISPTITSQAAARVQTWYAPGKLPLSTSQEIATRMALNLTGLGMILAAVWGTGQIWLWACLALACLTAGEVLGRWRFYGSYSRVGL